MTSMRRQEDRTPAPGIPAFRITVELPAAWQSYIANNTTDVFDDMDPDDPWNQAAADHEAAKLEKEGYALLGPMIGAAAEFGRHEGTLGAITTYEAVNHDILTADDAAGMWRFRPAGSETEYLILHGTEGVVWLPEHWRRKLADPACEIDECDIEWPDPAADEPAQPPPHGSRRDAGRLGPTRPHPAAPGPRRRLRAHGPDARGARVDPRPGPRRLPPRLVPRPVGTALPVRPDERARPGSRQRDPSLGPDRQ